MKKITLDMANESKEAIILICQNESTCMNILSTTNESIITITLHRMNELRKTITLHKANESNKRRIYSMYQYNFNTTSYITIEILKSKFFYLNNGNKYKFTFYNSSIEVISIIFNELYELLTFLCKLKNLIDQTSRDPYDVNYLYTSSPNEYGDIVEITSHYLSTLPIPSEDDDQIQFSIFKINEIYHKFSTIYNLNIDNSILDEFVEYIYYILECNSIEYLSLLQTISLNLSYGDFLK